jgi:TetR/AcrR family transcriptional regulator, tetracycline repressor protein
MPRKKPAHDRPARTAGRVPRNTLSRAAVVDAALAMIDRDGLDAVTMPKLAQHLGVGTMSLYRHVDNKDDLIAAVAEQVMGGITVPDGPPDDWQGRVVGYLRALRDAAIAHPALSRILADRGLTVGPVFDQLEQLHGILMSAGFSATDAVRAFYSLLTYVFGFVIWELPRAHQQPAEAYAAAWNHSIDALDPTDYPHLHALRPTLVTTASPDQFEYGLRQLVGALAATTDPSTKRRPRPARSPTNN